MSCGIEHLKCGTKWLDDVFDTYEDVQIGMEVPFCIKNITALKKNILSAIENQLPSEKDIENFMRTCAFMDCYNIHDRKRFARLVREYILETYRSTQEG